MFWLLLGKSAAKKSSFYKTARWIILGITFLSLALAALGCVATIATIASPVGVAVQAVQTITGGESKSLKETNFLSK